MNFRHLIVAAALGGSLASGSFAHAGTVAGPTAPQQSALDEHPVLARTPSELPRATGEPWKDLFAEGDEGVARRLGREVVVMLGGAESAYREGDFPVALDRLYGLLEAQPDLPPALLILGTTYFRLRRYGDSIVAFERLLEVAPGQVWRTQALAHAYYSLGDYDSALAHYEQVIPAQPEVSDEALRGHALAHYRLGQEDEALALLARAVELAPDNWEAHVWAAQIHFDRGDAELAQTSAVAARDLAPWEPRPWFVLSNVLYDLGEDEAAEQVEGRWRELDALTQNIRRVQGLMLFNPDSYNLAAELVQLAKRAGHRPAVRDGLDRMVRSIPPDIRRVDVYIFALDTLLELNDREAAAGAAHALTIDCADEADAWKRLEVYYALTRDRKRQIEAGEKARRLGGDY